MVECLLLWSQKEISQSQNVVRQQSPHPHRLTSFIELFHAANFNPSTVCAQVPFTFPATAVILGSSILLLSTVDTFGTGEHGDPNRGTLPGETGHQYVSVDSFFCFPYFPLVTLYLFLFDFPLSLPFPLGFFSCSPSFWEWPSATKQPRGDSSLLVARAERDRRREEEPRVDIYRYLSTVWKLGAHYASIDYIDYYRVESVQYRHIRQLSSLQIKPSSYLLFYSSLQWYCYYFHGEETPTEPQNIHQ